MSTRKLIHHRHFEEHKQLPKKRKRRAVNDSDEDDSDSDTNEKDTKVYKDDLNIHKRQRQGQVARVD